MTDPTTFTTTALTTTIVLSAPILAHGQQLDRLTLRPPTTADLIDLGQPMRLLPGAGPDETAIDVRMNVVAQYVVRLAAIPLSSVKALSLADFGQATQLVLGFFGGGDTAAGTGAGTAAGTTATGSSPTVSSN